MSGTTHVPRTLALVALLALGGLAWRLSVPAASHPDLIEHPLEAAGSKLILQYVAVHPFGSEYERSISLVSPRNEDVSVRLAADNGGHGRAQLYVDESGVYYLQGYFDLARIDTAAGTVEVVAPPRPARAKYLGAFDIVSGDRSRWRFLSSTQSPERLLVARGES